MSRFDRRTLGCVARVRERPARSGITANIKSLDTYVHLFHFGHYVMEELKKMNVF
jgi:hypothetical protein